MLLVLIIIISYVEKCFRDIQRLLYDGGFVKFDPKINELVDLAVDYWRLEKRIEKIKPQLTPENIKRMESSLRRIENYLRKNYIELSDYTGRFANDGINVDVIAVERDSTIKKPIIKETIEPMVYYKGNLRRKSQVIILDKE